MPTTPRPLSRFAARGAALVATAAVLLGPTIAAPTLASAARPATSNAVSGTCHPRYHGTAFGTSMNSARTDFRRWSTWIGRPECNARVYFPGAPPAHWGDNAILAHQPSNGRVVFSFKSGSRRDITRFERSRPAGTTCWASFFHEPEDNAKWRGKAGWAAYRARWGYYAPAIRAGGCTPTLILMRYTLNPYSKRFWRHWYNPRAVDVIAWDAYNTGRKAHPANYLSPAAMLAPIERVARRTGKPWGLGETGSPIIPGDTHGAQRCRWSGRLRSAVAGDGRAAFALWWDQTTRKHGVVTFANSANRCVARHWMNG